MGVPVILPLPIREIEILFTTCVISCITKLTQPVMSRSPVYILFSGPLSPNLHTTPHTGLTQGQDLGNPLYYSLLPLFYTLTRQHSELFFLPDSEV